MDIFSWILKPKKARNKSEMDHQECLLPFEKRQKMEEAYDTRKRGFQMVNLDQIVGSVGRYDDFDKKFRLKPHLPSERFVRVKQAMLEGKSLPPVKLFQIKDDYYIMDGNHRVAAAKALKRTQINAHIVELIPSKNSLENLLYLERCEFEEKTGLAERIELTEIGQYNCLKKQIEMHRDHLKSSREQPVNLQQAARDWYESIYLPLVNLIQKVNLTRSFPNRTTDDLFAYISHHQWELGRSRSYGIGIDELIPKDMEAFRKKMATIKPEDYPEMQRWVTAFVLMSVQGKWENKILDKLFHLPEIREIHSVHGSFDIIAKIVLSRDLLSSDAEIISQFVQKHIRMLNGVNSTQTLIPGASRTKA